MKTQTRAGAHGHRLRCAAASVGAALAVAGVMCPAQAASGGDSLTGHDKALHFVASAAIAGTVTMAMRGDEVTGFWVAAGVGALKELSDSQRNTGQGASGRDMLFNLLGAYTGAKLGGLWIRPERGGFSVGLQRAF